MDYLTKERLMRIAMEEAGYAIKDGNSCFGAVLADEEGRLIIKAHNTTNTDMNPIAHAEINLINKAATLLKTKDLSRYYLISNVQSCPMCFSAAIKSKIKNFIYGCAEDKTLNPKINVFELKKFCPSEINIESGILKKVCLEQLDSWRSSQK